jgi:hypothetical protein
MASRLSIAERGERLVYRVGGLPVALSAALDGKRAKDTDAVFAAHYWRPQDVGEWIELLGALVLWPIGLFGGALWYTARNGAIIRSRTGKGIGAQLFDQLRLYFSAGVLAPWYYMFSLHDDPSPERARSFVQRFETKPVLFKLLKRRKGSPLNDKVLFARHCQAHGVRCVETLMELERSAPVGELPDCDLFVKPSRSRGGRGAERWDRVAPHVYSGPDGQRLSASQLLELLVRRSRRTPLIVQPRMNPHPSIARLTAGALPTARIVTCLNEQGEPEPMVSTFRMSIGSNRTVDNMHAGGIAAGPDIPTGRLTRASDLGTDARLGWFSVHPDTGEQIEGRVVPCWEEAKSLAIKAHGAFSDRVVIGWDIAILEDGPILVEGNGNPDMDIIQRFMRFGIRRHRFGELLAYHVKQRTAGER